MVVEVVDVLAMVPPATQLDRRGTQREHDDRGEDDRGAGGEIGVVAHQQPDVRGRNTNHRSNGDDGRDAPPEERTGWALVYGFRR